MKNIVLSAIIATVAASAGLGQVDAAFARSHHHHNDGAAVAGGLAAGVIGGVIGGAIANSNEPRYYDPPPRPRCWYEDRQVRDAYDGGWHIESVRVCD